MKILRRDFLTILCWELAPLSAPARSGANRRYLHRLRGVGDYAASNGDPWPVLEAGHKPSRRRVQSALGTGLGYWRILRPADCRREGLSGLGAAYYFAKATAAQALFNLEITRMFRRPLQTERVHGDVRASDWSAGVERFWGSQEGAGNQMDQLFHGAEGSPQFTWQEWDPALKPLRLPRDNYSHMDGINDTQVDVGLFFRPTEAFLVPQHLRKSSGGTPFSEDVKRDLMKCDERDRRLRRSPPGTSIPSRIKIHRT